MRARLFVLLMILVLTALVIGQEKALTNEDIVKMLEGGLSPELIVTMIRNSPGEYDTNVDTLLALREKGLSDAILAAMVAANSRNDSGGVGSAEDTGTPGQPDTPPEVGVYYVDKSDKLTFMEPEIVTWKTGGFWKKAATAGLTKGHVNGIVSGLTSKYPLAGDEEILVYCLEGTSATEYQLLKLWEKKDRRTFRAVTGGIIHASSGADENLVAFEPVRVRPRIYGFNLPSLPPGEYGLLPPGAATSASAASMGKIYSFTVGR